MLLLGSYTIIHFQGCQKLFCRYRTFLANFSKSRTISPHTYVANHAQRPHIVKFMKNVYTIILISKLMKIRYIDPTRLFWVYMIILNSNKGNLHDYSEFTIIRNCRVSDYRINFLMFLLYNSE